MTVLFPFVELEFVHAIGPTAGRYVVAVDPAAAEHEQEAGAVVEDLLQIQVVSGATTSKGLRRRTRDATAADTPADIPVLRVMWIGASQGVSDRAIADQRLERLRAQEIEREELLEVILQVLNVAVRAHRAATRDPYVTEVTRADPRAVRFGYGEPRPLTQGQWTEAFLAPPLRVERIDRAVRLGPTETVALALRDKLDLLESEELVLRAMLDLDQGRWRSACLQLLGAVTLLRADLGDARARGVAAANCGEDLAGREDRIRVLVELALAGDLGPAAQSELRSACDAVADTLERWRTPVGELV